MHTSFQQGTNPTRTGLLQPRRFQPYGTLSRTRMIEHTNVEAGPSTLVPPRAPYVGLPAPNPSGGLSGTAVDAENNQTNTEENKAPVSNFYRSHALRVAEWSSRRQKPTRKRAPRGKVDIRPHRVRMNAFLPRLRNWAKGRRIQEAKLDFNDILSSTYISPSAKRRS